MQEVIPIGLCHVTENLIDAKRYQHNFCDTIILRSREKTLEAKLTPIKREINSREAQLKYLEGHKAVIVHNIDQIIALVASRYTNIDLNLADAIVENGKLLVNKVLAADSFEKLSELSPMFKSKISLPVYDLFIRQLKKSNISMV